MPPQRVARTCIDPIGAKTRPANGAERARRGRTSEKVNMRTVSKVYRVGFPQKGVALHLGHVKVKAGAYASARRVAPSHATLAWPAAQLRRGSAAQRRVGGTLSARPGGARPSARPEAKGPFAWRALGKLATNTWHILLLAYTPFGLLCVDAGVTATCG